MPLEDMHQSYTLLSLYESEGQTVMTFQRSIQACDNQDLQITVRHFLIFFGFFCSEFDAQLIQVLHMYLHQPSHSVG